MTVDSKANELAEKAIVRCADVFPLPYLLMSSFKMPIS